MALCYGTMQVADRRTFSSKVRDVSEFLAGFPIEKPKGTRNARVTYHDPCHCAEDKMSGKTTLSTLLIDGLDFVDYRI